MVDIQSGMAKIRRGKKEEDCILRAGVQPTPDPYAEAFIAGPLR